MEVVRGAPLPPIIFERLNWPQQAIYYWKVNLSWTQIHFWYRKNILISRLYEQFSRNAPQCLQNGCPKKISDFSNMNILYIALKHVIWGLWICNYFREIFRFRDFMNTKTFHEICAHTFPKFKYFAKQFILTESPDHVIITYNMITIYYTSSKFLLYITIEFGGK